MEHPGPGSGLGQHRPELSDPSKVYNTQHRQDEDGKDHDDPLDEIGHGHGQETPRNGVEEYHAAADQDPCMVVDGDGPPGRDDPGEGRLEDLSGGDELGGYVGCVKGENDSHGDHPQWDVPTRTET